MLQLFTDYPYTRRAPLQHVILTINRDRGWSFHFVPAIVVQVERGSVSSTIIKKPDRVSEN